MSEFNTYFGNLPPGCREDDPRAPWNEEDIEETLVDRLHYLFKKHGMEYEYSGDGEFYLEDYGKVIKVEDE